MLKRFVDPHLGWNRYWWFRCLVDEAFGMDAIGGIEHGLALLENARGLVVVHRDRSMVNAFVGRPSSPSRD